MCDRPYCLVPEPFRCPQRKPVSVKHSFPCVPQPPPASQGLAVLPDGSILDVCSEWNLEYVTWLLLLAVMFSSFLHVVACARTPWSPPFFLCFIVVK